MGITAIGAAGPRSIHLAPSWRRPARASLCRIEWMATVNAWGGPSVVEKIDAQTWWLTRTAPPYSWEWRPFVVICSNEQAWYPIKLGKAPRNDWNPWWIRHAPSPSWQDLPVVDYELNNSEARENSVTFDEPAEREDHETQSNSVNVVLKKTTPSRFNVPLNLNITWYRYDATEKWERKICRSTKQAE